MKRNHLKTALLLFTYAISLNACKEDLDLPTLSTTIVSEIKATSALSGGRVTSDGGAQVIARGVCWSTAPNPTTSSDTTVNGSGAGTFTSTVSGLKENTAYYVRSYATNSEGTAYGNEVTFVSTQLSLAKVTTTDVSEITSTTALVGGSVTDDGGDLINESGICVSVSENPSVNDSKYEFKRAPMVYDFWIEMADLLPGTTYYVRSYAISSAGTAYGNQISFTTSLPQAGSWSKITDFPDGIRYYSNGFTIGTKVYLGFGQDSTFWDPRADLWEWDQSSGIWTRKADFPGGSTYADVGFSIGTKGYIFTGETDLNEFWEYDPATNSWSKKASLPNMPARGASTGFSIGNKGYIALGAYRDGRDYYKDLWEWDQETNLWTKKSDFPGTIRTSAVSFAIGNKGYIGTGMSFNSLTNEFWEWDQQTDTWTRKADFKGKSRMAGSGFVIGNRGYIGTGTSNDSKYYRDFWEWNQSTDEWLEVNSFGGKARDNAIGFSIGNRGYVGIGAGNTNAHPNNSDFQDFWEYVP